MPTIDLFNKSADEALIASALANGTFRLRSKMYAKYFLKSTGQTLLVSAVVTLAAIGALAVIADALNPATEESE